MNYRLISLGIVPTFLRNIIISILGHIKNTFPNFFEIYVYLIILIKGTGLTLIETKKIQLSIYINF